MLELFQRYYLRGVFAKIKTEPQKRVSIFWVNVYLVDPGTL